MSALAIRRLSCGAKAEGISMPEPTDLTGAGERRNNDRRAAAQPFAGEDRRTGERRSGKDRRGAPRV